ncbi:MAG TPA: MFS transporter [Longimicrobiales bacterium]|nr:MFS transporter [Longimicrobiales bacterium]
MKRSRMAVLLMAVLIDMMGFGIVIPVLPFYALELGASALEVTALIASFSAMQMAATPIWGRFSDRRGRRPLIIAGLFASAVSYLLFGLANSLWLLLVSRMAAGAAGGTISVAQAYVADATTKEERAHWMGQIGAASGLGVMLGPAVGGFFSQFGLGTPGFVAAALCLVNAIAALILLPESRPARSAAAVHTGETATLAGWVRVMGRQPLSLLLGVYFLGISSFTAITALLALYFEQRFGIGAQDMGFLFTVAGGTTVIVRGALLGMLVRHFGEPATVRLGAFGLLLSAALIPLMPSFWLAALLTPVYAFGAGTLFPALATLVSFATDSDSQGSVLGGSQVVGGLGRVTAPLWAGWLFQSAGAGTPYHVAAVVAATSLLLALRIPTLHRAAPGGAGTPFRDELRGPETGGAAASVAPGK